MRIDRKINNFLFRNNRIFWITGFVIGYIVLVTLIASIATEPTLDSEQWKVEVYAVERGETLWAIGDRLCPENVDVRDWVKEVQKLNDMSNSKIYAGQRLEILVPLD